MISRKSGKLDVAKRLFSLASINIRVKDDYGFEYKNGKISNAYILKNGKKHCVSCRILYTDRQCCKCKEE
jgi:hypothetical protein